MFTSNCIDETIAQEEVIPTWLKILYLVLKVSKKLHSKLTIFLDSSMVEHAAVNRGVVGSSPTRGVFLNFIGSVVKRLRHRPFTAVTRVRFSSESLQYGAVAKW